MVEKNSPNKEIARGVCYWWHVNSVSAESQVFLPSKFEPQQTKKYENSRMKSRENSADLISNIVLAEIFALKARTHTQKIKRLPVI